MMKISMGRIEEWFGRTRGQEVILDADAAAFYRVSLRAVRAAVGRSPRRFPADVAFRLSPEEARLLGGGAKGSRAPLAFTWAGFMMLASVLKSETAVRTSIWGIRTLGAAGLLPKLEDLPKLSRSA